MADPILPSIQLEIPNEEMDRAESTALKKKTEKLNQKSKNISKNIKENKTLKGAFDFLKDINKWLERYPVRIIDAFNNFVGNGEVILQEKVDQICEWLAWKINIAIERKRQTILRVLHEQYEDTVIGKLQAAATAVKKFFQNPLKAIGDFAATVFGPVYQVFRWVADLAVEILKLAENLAKIMQLLPPTPPNPRINFDKFQIKIRSISLNEVVMDPDGWPTPEVLFPEPEKPFTKEGFQRAFETASAKLKSGRKKYTLSEADKKTLQGFGQSKTLEQSIVDATMGGFEPIEQINFDDDIFSK